MLEVINISKSFGNIKAVQSVSFSANEGKILGLIGKNGAGKSTIFRIILDILKPDSGKVVVAGEKSSLSINNCIGFLPEEGSLMGELTVYEQMCFYGSLRNMSEEQVLQELLKWLEKFDITEYLNRKIKELSKGNRQRLQFIVSVLHNPKVLILDEPFSGLDPLGVELFKEILLELKAMGKVIIFSSHRMEHIEKFSDDIIILDNGQILMQGTLKEVKDEYRKVNNISCDTSLNDMFIELLGGNANDNQ
ncbi:MAG: ATP-binding cassette domain-containing protein [Clostridia bacterium]|nr:ATP-binding cassette domain-containing protein [Clostridia bacterium]